MYSEHFFTQPHGLVEDYFSDIRYVLATQVKDQKTQQQLNAAGFVVITQR